MKIRHSILRYSLILIPFAVPAISFAQDKPTDPSSMTEEIEVVRPYKPVLADAVKIRRNPDLNDTKPFKPALSYAIPDKRLDLDTYIRPLQGQELSMKPALALKNNYLKVGAGNMNGGLGELYISNGSDEALQAGFFLKHFNQEGSLNKQKFSVQQASVFGRSILDQITLNGALGYDRISTYFYGFNPAAPASNPDPAKQRYSLVKLNGELLKNRGSSDNGVNYSLKGDLYFLQSLTKSKESSFALSGLISKAINNFDFGINGSADFTGTKDSLSNTGNNILHANPYVRLQGTNYKLNVGLNLVSEFGDASRTNLLPAVTAEADIIPKYATVFAGFTGDVMKTSLRQLSLENPYLSNSLTIKNALEKSNIYGGIKGNAGGGMGYKISAYYKTVTNLPLLVNSVNGVQKFDVVYDGGDSKIAGFEGEISLNTLEGFNWTGKLLINNYNLATEREAWGKPDFQVVSNMRMSVNRKLIINGEVLLTGETQAKTYTYTPLPVESIVGIKSFVDLSGGAEYRFADKIGLYVHVNNILGTKYQQFLYYPKLGLNVLGGFNYSF
jgi:hypothetical protein